MLIPGASTSTAVFLMLALGLRHGLDPEHIAIVNSVAQRAAADGRRLPWLCGAYFALGHGLVITVTAMGLTGLLDLGRPPAWAVVLAAWLPALILLLVATVNLRELLRPQHSGYRPANVKARLLPRPLRDSAHPLAVFLIGMLFAPFVDPATQAAVWGYAVGAADGFREVAGLGGVLTLAMAVTCMLEARGVLLLMGSGDPGRADRRRRQVGWAIVAFSYLIVGYTLVHALLPSLDWRLSLPATLGAALVLSAAAVIGMNGLARRTDRG